MGEQGGQPHPAESVHERRRMNAEERKRFAAAQLAVSEYAKQFGVIVAPLPAERVVVYDPNQWGRHGAAVYESKKDTLFIVEQKTSVEFFHLLVHELLHRASLRRSTNGRVTGHGLTNPKSIDGDHTALDEAVTETAAQQITHAAIASGVFEGVSIESSEHIFGYHNERLALKKLIAAIYNKNRGTFISEDMVAMLFMRAHITANTETLAHVIDKTFGKGTWASLGTMRYKQIIRLADA